MASVKLCECGCGRVAPVARYSLTAYGWIKGQPKRFVRGHHRRGYRWSEEEKAKISGKNSAAWKADQVGYSALHTWVSKQKVKVGKCSTCSYQGKTEWANISGAYFRDLDDFAEMCTSCHRELDVDED